MPPNNRERLNTGESFSGTVPHQRKHRSYTVDVATSTVLVVDQHLNPHTPVRAFRTSSSSVAAASPAIGTTTSTTSAITATSSGGNRERTHTAGSYTSTHHFALSDLYMEEGKYEDNGNGGLYHNSHPFLDKTPYLAKQPPVITPTTSPLASSSSPTFVNGSGGGSKSLVSSPPRRRKLVEWIQKQPVPQSWQLLPRPMKNNNGGGTFFPYPRRTNPTTTTSSLLLPPHSGNGSSHHYHHLKDDDDDIDHHHSSHSTSATTTPVVYFITGLDHVLYGTVPAADAVRIAGIQPPRYLWYMLSGALCDIIQLTMDVLLHVLFHIEDASVCWALGFMLSIVFRHTSHRYFVFGDYVGGYWASLLRMYAGYSIIIVLSTGFNIVMTKVATLSHYLAWVLTLLWTGIANYFILKRIWSFGGDTVAVAGSGTGGGARGNKVGVAGGVATMGSPSRVVG